VCKVVGAEVALQKGADDEREQFCVLCAISIVQRQGNIIADKSSVVG
jgi:hypothetical protein